uniref:Uncharacterized protein n=1 Tax=Rousettus aegyptiacus TaxID=9407 RepID=A0A7J8IFJ3_ROUAE|nr:hypothetical protein HJG63_001945 [Rousettus aegyptiacus]
MAGEFAQSPVLQGQGGARGHLPVQLPWPGVCQPRLVLHTILKPSRPKGYQLLLPSVPRQRGRR